jgi:hypothetical protein
MNKSRVVNAALVGAAICCLLPAGCDRPEYDLSTPDAAIDSMQKMVEDGRPERLVELLHIKPRDLAFDDGVTEKSAIEDVRKKAGDLLAQLYRVSRKLNDNYPNEVVAQTEFARSELGFLFGAAFEKGMSEFLRDPFSFVRVQRERITTIEMEDGDRRIAAILWDGQPALGEIGLQMTRVEGQWKIEIPIDMPPVSEFRPETREEWRVIANIMLAFENSLRDFEDALDGGEYRTLADASGAAGRMLGESAIVQGAIYAMMKRDALD